MPRRRGSLAGAGGTACENSWVGSGSAATTVSGGSTGRTGVVGPAARNSRTWAIDQRSAGSRVIVASSSGASQPAFGSRGGSSCTIRYIAPSTLSPTWYGGWPASAW